MIVESIRLTWCLYTKLEEKTKRQRTKSKASEPVRQKASGKSNRENRALTYKLNDMKEFLGNWLEQVQTMPLLIAKQQTNVIIIVKRGPRDLTWHLPLILTWLLWGRRYQQIKEVGLSVVKYPVQYKAVISEASAPLYFITSLSQKIMPRIFLTVLD